MSSDRLSFFRFSSPGPATLWLLEGAIALILAAYCANEMHGPLVPLLNRWMAGTTAARISGAALIVLILPLLWMLFKRVLTLATTRFTPAVRTLFGLIALGLLITLVAVPAARNYLDGRTIQPIEAQTTMHDAQVQAGPLDHAPQPLKLERIRLGAEITNGGTLPVEVTAMFVRPNERGRLYCAGKPLYGDKSARVRLKAGESAIFQSGNCQDGNVALTVWDANGRRIYQTSAHAAQK